MPPASEFLQADHLERLRSRDPSAFHAEYRAHGGVLTREARRLGFAASEADELTQSVWATFLEIAPRFEGRSQVRTFLLGILRRKAAWARRRSSRVTPVDPTTLGGLNAPDHEAALVALELERAVSDCVAALHGKERGAVELKLIFNQETPTVSRLLGVSANYLGVLLHRARSHLRECLQSHLA